MDKNKTFLLMNFCGIFLIIILNITSGTMAEKIQLRAELLKMLTANQARNKLVLPRDSNDPIQVKLWLENFRIIKVKKIENKFTYSANFYLKWMDLRLSWEEGYYGGIPCVSLPASDIWKPDILPTIGKPDLFFSLPNNIFATVHYNGVVTTSLPLVENEMFCNFNGSEKLICKEKFSSWTLSSVDVVVLYDFKSQGNSLKIKQEDEDWNVTRTEIKINKVNHSCCPGTFQEVTLTIELQSMIIKEKPINWAMPFIVFTPLLAFISLKQQAARLIITSVFIIVASLCIAMTENTEYSLSYKKDLKRCIFIALIVLLWTIIISNILYLLLSISWKKNTSIFVSILSVICILPRKSNVPELRIKNSKLNEGRRDNKRSSHRCWIGEFAILVLDRLFAMLMLTCFVLIWFLPEFYEFVSIFD